MKNSNNYSYEELTVMGIQSHPTVCVDRTVKFYGEGPVKLAEKARIDAYTVITGSVTIGKRVHVGAFCYLQGTQGLILEDYSGISSRVAIYTCSDDYTEGYMAGPQIPSKMRKTHSAPVIIGKAALIGTNSVILPGVIIGCGGSVGAMSLVKQSISNYDIVAGIPAKQIGKRNEKLCEFYIKELDNL
jgi:galactoside O-acetyltransferase